MKIKITKLAPEAQLPVRATDGSAGYDLTAVSRTQQLYYTELDTGLGIEIPKGYVGLLFPRSSISKYPNTQLANSVGVLDPDYRGNVCLRFRGNVPYTPGDRIGQLVVVPCCELEFDLVDKLEDTERGDGGFGSTGE